MMMRTSKTIAPVADKQHRLENFCLNYDRPIGLNVGLACERRWRNCGPQNDVAKAPDPGSRKDGRQGLEFRTTVPLL